MTKVTRITFVLGVFLLAMGILIACNSLPDLPTRTPEPEPVEEAVATAAAGEMEEGGEATGAVAAAEAAEPGPEAIVQPIAAPATGMGAAAKAVDLIGAWVEAGVPETSPFDYVGMDGGTYQAVFEVDILPLFTTTGIWFDGSRACGGCHFANNEASAHEMNLSTYDGILAGADVLEEPPGVSILGESEPGVGDYDWEASKLRARLRNNRMPPGWEFDVTEENRDGYCVEVSADGVDILEGEYGCDLNAVGLIAAWVQAGAPEADTFEYGGGQLTFDRDVQPFFTEHNMWFDGSQACTGCHFANSENSYHEMDLSTHQGMLAGADVLEEPPGVSILGESAAGAGDFDWDNAKLHARLRNNRMPPGWEFDITEENRDGPYVLHGKRVEPEAAVAESIGGEAITTPGTPSSVTSIKTTTVTEPDGTTTTTTETTITHYGPLAAAEETGCAIYAVDVIGAWVDAGAPELDPFDYVSVDGEACSGVFEHDILPLFTQPNVWFNGSQACTGCHFANSENSYHEMNLSSYEGILAGADVLEEPPGVSILGESVPGAGDFDWDNSELRARLRNNRMPPGWEFDITEENRDGPTLTISAVDVRAVDLIAAWVEAGAPETEAFGEYNATFNENVLPLFTEANAWFEGSQPCAGCHFANNENSYHEMNLSSYEGVLAGADVLEEPPGVSILGESEPGAGDFDWDSSELHARLRNNRMPPGSVFDITEANRNGPLVRHGAPVGAGLGAGGTASLFGSGECEVRAVNLIGAWVNAGAPEIEDFAFSAEDGSTCAGGFEADVLPLFTANNAWFEGSQACTGCHFANSEDSYHEMDLSSYEGILAGADVLEEPPGVSILGESVPGAGDFDWENSKLHARLRNNRMPPGWEFDITEENRNGPTLTINGVDTRAVDLIAAWVEAGAPETEAFGDYNATFSEHVLPLFTDEGMWFEGSQACVGCHFANGENSYHEMDLSSYVGILAGADVLEEPPGVSILGESAPGAGDYDWDSAKLHARLRNNRMPPGSEFDITEENRDGPTILAGRRS